MQRRRRESERDRRPKTKPSHPLVSQGENGKTLDSVFIHGGDCLLAEHHFCIGNSAAIFGFWIHSRSYEHSFNDTTSKQKSMCKFYLTNWLFVDNENVTWEEWSCCRCCCFCRRSTFNGKSTPIRKIVESSSPLNTKIVAEMDPKDFLLAVFVVVIAPHVTNNRLAIVRLTETKKAATRVNLDKV